jgi:UDP-N-acetylmuramate dehydrogenase
MKNYLEIGNQFITMIGKENVLLKEPMCSHTSFKVGGPADILVTPESYEDVQNIIKYCINYNIPYIIIGNGSNLLVKDGGIRGVVVKLTKLNKIEIEGEKLIAQSGVLVSDVSQAALNATLTGFEFACGIPGCVGGAVAMNAGAYISDVSNVIQSAVVIDKEGNLKNLSKDELELGYRNSAVLKYGYTVVEATFKLVTGDYDTIKNKIEDLQKRRKEKQPLEYPSAGSTFKRPEGYFAGKLIEDCNLKGSKVGDAEVSVKHSGFIINKGNATAKEILSLISLVQKTVYEEFGVELHPEVRIIGEEKN